MTRRTDRLEQEIRDLQRLSSANAATVTAQREEIRNTQRDFERGYELGVQEGLNKAAEAAGTKRSYNYEEFGKLLDYALQLHHAEAIKIDGLDGLTHILIELDRIASGG